MIAAPSTTSDLCTAVMAGDAPSFTQRFYFSLVRGCIPVRVDPFKRVRAGAGEPAAAYPFPTLIDWSRIVVNVEANTTSYGALVARLLG